MSGIGALIGLSVGIFLIVKKFNPAYSLMFSALLAGLIGFQDLTLTLQYMIDGVKDMAPAIVRILSAVDNISVSQKAPSAPCIYFDVHIYRACPLFLRYICYPSVGHLLFPRSRCGDKRDRRGCGNSCFRLEDPRRTARASACKAA